MGYKKCPRCELNYIRDDQQLCDVCSRKRKASDDDNEVLMCIECGENPAMKGKEEIPELDGSFDDDDEGYIDEDRENGDD